MALPGLGPFSAATANVAAEDRAKKVRKPYIITKSRESWTQPEHDKFLEALQLFDRDWKKIKAFIGSKTVLQIRSHAQKYFLKVEKNGTNEHLPPPRPKRKSAHPYPQKASKNAQVPPPQAPVSFPPSSPLLESGYVLQPNSNSIPGTPISSATVMAWPNNTIPTVSSPHTINGIQLVNNSSSSSESTQKTQSVREPTEPDQNNPSLRVLPDFAEVYGFIGSVFDPNVTDHLQKLKKMDPIDVETVMLLMRNLSINLTSPDFEDHMKLLSSYESDFEHHSQGTESCGFQDLQCKNIV